MRTFSVTWFAWCICGVTALLAVTASLITFIPPNDWVGLLLSGVFAGFAVIAAIIAFVLGRLPATHWVHQSHPLKIGMAAFAILMTLLMVMVF